MVRMSVVVGRHYGLQIIGGRNQRQVKAVLKQLQNAEDFCVCNGASTMELVVAL
jgi:hypothetical protein